MSYLQPYIEIGHRPIEVVKGNRFELSAKERGELYTAKMKHRKELQKRYGRDWKRHLNVPERSIVKAIHIN